MYGVVWLLFFHAALLTTVMCLRSFWTLLYGVPLLLALVALLPALGYGMTGFYLKAFRYEKPDATCAFDGLRKGNYRRVAMLYLVKFGIWLGLTVLLIVPGIVFAVRTCMATYLLRADPQMKTTDALQASNRIMKKHGGKYFGLALSFLGWFVVGLITAGIGFVWAVPYYDNAKVVFYKRELAGDTKAYRAEAKQTSDTLPPENTAVAADISENTVAECADGAQAFADRADAQSSDDADATAYGFAAEAVQEPFVSDEDYGAFDASFADMPAQAEQTQAEIVYAERESVSAPAPAPSGADKERENLRALQAELRRRRAVPPRASAQSDEARPLSRVERRPLPGSRTVLDEMRGRVVAARRSREESGQTPLPPRDSAAKPGESSLDRLRRLRDERAAKYGATPQKNDSEENV